MRQSIMYMSQNNKCKHKAITIVTSMSWSADVLKMIGLDLEDLDIIITCQNDF